MRVIQAAGVAKLQKIGVGLIQITVLYLFSVGGNYLAEKIHLNFPGSLLGMGGLFLCLQLRIFPYKWVAIGGNWLLTELLLFFIPSIVAVVQYKSLIYQAGLQFLGIILVGTVIVMISSGLTAEFMIQHRQGRG